MSRFSAIDLSAYPLPDLIEVLDAEAYLTRNKTLFVSAWDDIRGAQPAIDVLALEHEPITAQLRMAAELERLLRGDINDRIKMLTLAGAQGRFLDHLGVTYYGGLTRRIITPADDQTGAPSVLEDDETFRQRIALAPESWSTAGPEGAYLFWALSSSGDVLDVAVYSEDEGVCLAPRIRVVVLSRLTDGVASPELIAQVRNTLRRSDLRPMGDLVSVESAVPFVFNVDLTLRIRAGASSELVREAAEARVRSYCEGRYRWIGDGVSGPVYLIGRRLRQDTIAAAAYGNDPNILEVVVNEPSTDINPPHAGYVEAALNGVGTEAFEPLAPEITAHLFTAPRLGTLSVTTEIATGGWA